MPETVRHLTGTGVRVRPDPDRRHVERGYGAQRVLEMLAVLLLCRHRMLDHQDERLRDVDLVADTVAIQRVAGDRRRGLRRHVDVQ